MAETEIDRARKRVEKLREQIASESYKLLEQTQQGDATLYAAQLAAEEDRLKNELASVKATAKSSTVKAGVQQVVDQVQDGPSAPEQPVDQSREAAKE